MANFDAKITSKGQITIPVEIREAWKLQTGDKVEFFKDHKGRLGIRPCNAGPIDFLSVVSPRQKSPGFPVDDDALGVVDTSDQSLVSQQRVA